MNALVRTFPASAVVTKSWVAVLADLTKARLTSLVLVTTLVGFYAGTSGPTNYAVLWFTLVGTGLLAAGGAALNQLLEREHDARMRRTRERPLPSGRLEPRTVLWLGCLWAAAGLGALGWGVNILTALLGAITLVIYVAIYTPLKRVTWWNTVVGAVPGALPPLIGWAAAKGELSAGGWFLFAVQFLWQIPHFLAIAWLYRDEYSAAGFKMLPVVDVSGRRTGAYALLCAVALLVTSMWPVWSGMTGDLYGGGALLFGLGFAVLAAAFALGLSARSARGLFYGSIVYLPSVLVLLVVDRLVR